MDDQSLPERTSDLAPLTVRSSRLMQGIIVYTSLSLIIFLSWLAQTSRNPAAGLSAAFGLAWAIVTAAIIKQPFMLVISADGLIIRMPFGEVFYAWASFESFAVRKADPVTTHIVFKLKPDVDRPWFFRHFRRGGFDGSLFPYFEIRNRDLLQILRKYQFQGRTRLIV